MAINLDKQVEKVGIILDKRGINNVPCQVKLAIDRSGSMDHLYRNGTVQKVVERILAISMKVDKDGTVDVWAFHNNSLPAKAVTSKLIEGYVRKEIEKFSTGGTSYAPVMEDILNELKPKSASLFGLFGKPTKVANDPVFAIFVTDGENDDKRDAEKIIVDSQAYNIYWQLVGIGGSSFRFIEEMGDKYPNCGFVAIDNIVTIDDDDLYEGLINDEFATWVKKFQ